MNELQSKVLYYINKVVTKIVAGCCYHVHFIPDPLNLKGLGKLLMNRNC